MGYNGISWEKLERNGNMAGNRGIRGVFIVIFEGFKINEQNSLNGCGSAGKALQREMPTRAILIICS
jgi:hypothetical protein